MKKQQKQSYLLLAVAVIVVLVVWLFRTKHSGPETPTTQNNSTKTSSTVSAAQNSPGVWFGTLKFSDSANRGNFMLVTKDKTIYIKTSRDFASLVGKQVYVTYQGDLSSFVLGDISENLRQGN